MIAKTNCHPGVHYDPLVPPMLLKWEIPITEYAKSMVQELRRDAADVIAQDSDKLLVIVGPDSIRDSPEALEYGLRLKSIARELSEDLVIMMRANVETSDQSANYSGWNGLMIDPDVNESFDINRGLRVSRKLFADFAEAGIPIASEIKSTIAPLYLADMITVGIISKNLPTYRELSSSFTFPVGFKSSKLGLEDTHETIDSAAHPHHFLHLTEQGLPGIVHTLGNTDGFTISPHLRDNADAYRSASARRRGLHVRVVDSAFHGYDDQHRVVSDLCQQIVSGQDEASDVVGVVIQSNLQEGKQSPSLDGKLTLKPGVSITEPCIGWQTTVQLLRQISSAVQCRRRLEKGNNGLQQLADADLEILKNVNGNGLKRFLSATPELSNCNSMSTIDTQKTRSSQLENQRRKRTRICTVPQKMHLSNGDTKNGNDVNGTKIRDGEALRDIGDAIKNNIDIFLGALEDEGLPAPSFEQGSTTAVPKDLAGVQAQRKIIELVERLGALVTGPAGLYGISRQFLENSAIQVAIDLNFAEVIPIGKSIDAEEISEKTGADKTVIVRIMRSLTPLYIFAEVAPQRYKHTARSSSMLDPSIKSLISFGGNDCYRAGAFLAESLKEQNYQNPTEPGQVAFQRAYDTQLPYFPHVFDKEPDMGARFTDAMSGTVKLSYEVGEIAEIFPFDTLSVSNQTSTIVDVGGGKGQVMLSIRKRYPVAKNLRFIVQDFESNIVAGKAACPKQYLQDIAFQKHNFFDAQPVKGAAAYFLRHILHDWSDKYCRKILLPIVEAMDPETSRILIADMVVPDQNAPRAVAHRDLLMMAHLAGMERAESHFEQLFKSVHPDLTIVKIWKISTSGPGGFRILEVRLRK